MQCFRRRIEGKYRTYWLRLMRESGLRCKLGRGYTKIGKIGSIQSEKQREFVVGIFDQESVCRDYEKGGNLIEWCFGRYEIWKENEGPCMVQLPNYPFIQGNMM